MREFASTAARAMSCIVLLIALADAPVAAEPSAEQVAAIGSQDMDEATWLKLAARTQAAADDAGLGSAVRINRSGCFSQCGNGPMVVVYPEGVWYAAVSPSDAPEIVERHLVHGEPVERLRFRPGTPGPHKLERDADGRPMGRPDPWPSR